MNNIIYDLYCIGKTTISLEFLPDESCYAVGIKYKNEYPDYSCFDGKNRACELFKKMINSSNPWIDMGITENIPNDWDKI